MQYFYECIKIRDLLVNGIKHNPPYGPYCFFFNKISHTVINSFRDYEKCVKHIVII